MDIVTQIALGAAVGEATLGRKVGWRAPVWGGLCGLLPDLNVLWPFADPVSAFTWHRGYTHALAVLVLATLIVAWLALTLVIKAHVDRVAGDSLPAGVTRYLTTPSPFNAVLWRVVAMTGEGRYLEGYYSLLDSEPRVSFVSRPDGHERLEPLRSEAAVARLMWFSRGFFSGRELGSGEIVISDLRMGFDEGLVFSFVVGRREGDAIEPAPVRRRPGPEFPPGTDGACDRVRKATWRGRPQLRPDPPHPMQSITAGSGTQPQRSRKIAGTTHNHHRLILRKGVSFRNAAKHGCKRYSGSLRRFSIRHAVPHIQATLHIAVEPCRRAQKPRGIRLQRLHVLASHDDPEASGQIVALQPGSFHAMAPVPGRSD